MRKTFFLIASLLLSMTVSGCATVGDMMNPFESEFSCKKSDTSGQCGSLATTYQRDVTEYKEQHNIQPEDQSDKGEKGKVPTLSFADKAESQYKSAKLNRMTQMLNEPVTPVVAPPTVIRILILPYRDEDNGLNLMRYSYLMVDKPQWVMGDYLEGAANAGE